MYDKGMQLKESRECAKFRQFIKGFLTHYGYRHFDYCGVLGAFVQQNPIMFGVRLMSYAHRAPMHYVYALWNPRYHPDEGFYYWDNIEWCDEFRKDYDSEESS